MHPITQTHLKKLKSCMMIEYTQSNPKSGRSRSARTVQYINAVGENVIESPGIAVYAHQKLGVNLHDVWTIMKNYLHS